MKKVIIIAAALIVLVGGYFVYKKLSTPKTTASLPFTQEIKDNSFTLAQGKNKVTGQYVDPSTLNLGVSVYPNSSPTQDQKPAGNFDLNGVKLTAATYQTSDERSKVESYYKNQFGSDAISSSLVDTDATYMIIKSKSNTGPIVNVWVENEATYFTIIKPN
jgi:hypothetical protein